jgi:hypothetical protein
MSQGGNQPLHFADGGYYDNSGVLAAVEWLDHARDQLSGHRVLFITIDENSVAENQKGGSWSWQRQIIGPIETLISTRSSCQSTRDSLESTLAVEALSALTVVTPVKFDFIGKGSIPLSWHLTTDQKNEIDHY